MGLNSTQYRGKNKSLLFSLCFPFRTLTRKRRYILLLSMVIWKLYKFCWNITQIQISRIVGMRLLWTWQHFMEGKPSWNIPIEWTIMKYFFKFVKCNLTWNLLLFLIPELKLLEYYLKLTLSLWDHIQHMEEQCIRILHYIWQVETDTGNIIMQSCIFS